MNTINTLEINFRDLSAGNDFYSLATTLTHEGKEFNFVTANWDYGNNWINGWLYQAEDGTELIIIND